VLVLIDGEKPMGSINGLICIRKLEISITAHHPFPSNESSSSAFLVDRPDELFASALITKYARKLIQKVSA